MQLRSLFPNHSFRLILYLEWILLGITLLGEIRPTPHGMNPTSLFLLILAIIAFGFMGLKLPTGKTQNKVLYTGLEFGLLFLTFLLDKRTIFFPLLGVIIVIRSCLIFQQIGRLIVAGMVFIFFLVMMFQQFPEPPPRHHEPPPPPMGVAPPPPPQDRPHPPRKEPLPESFAQTILALKLNTAVIYGLALIFILLLVNALLAERQSREKLLLANNQLRQYALRIEDQATLQERNRIAREIHDSLGHALTAQSIQLENALLFLPPDAEKTGKFLREAKQLGARALQEVRRSIATLRTHPLQGQSLEVAIAKAINEFQQTTNIKPNYKIEIFHSISGEISTAIYRIIQESLTNIYKHSAATEINIYLHQTQETIYLEINDNGKGFNPEENTTGFGLQGMRERTSPLGGQFFIVSQPGKGCRITVSIPLPKLAV
ncbi:sensor histidine kinase [Phormidium sp. LEGE 05292]|uniref:sensor histidine kinase n=1 Tax=[Phormidium] sp. LEGE 05292 TaxID=767427 RepID=UPI00187EF437|nr:sensor histidine kinase [Phormidium sp. LEGE 05292]MBE9228893.1 sensor histidine kinase [Phormidium sp. LEGE 05292]